MPILTAGIISGRRYAIGDVGPGGGYVFITPTTASNSTGLYFETPEKTWSAAANGDNVTAGLAGGPMCVGALGTTYQGNSNTAIGSGAANTTFVAGLAGPGTACYLAENLTYNDYTDWFIPSRDELQKLYDNRASLGAANSFVGSQYYWSSTETTDPPNPFGDVMNFTMQLGLAAQTMAASGKPSSLGMAVRIVRSFAARY
jgi:hypothetical protein